MREIYAWEKIFLHPSSLLLHPLSIRLQEIVSVSVPDYLLSELNSTPARNIVLPRKSAGCHMSARSQVSAPEYLLYELNSTPARNVLLPRKSAGCHMSARSQISAGSQVPLNWHWAPGLLLLCVCCSPLHRPQIRSHVVWWCSTCIISVVLLIRGTVFRLRCIWSSKVRWSIL